MQRRNEYFNNYYDYAMAKDLRRQEEIKREKEIEEQKILPVIELAKKGDVDAILKLKNFAKDGNEKAKNALEKLYWDGNKDHAVGTVVIRDGVTSIGERAFKGCTALKKITYSRKIESRLKKFSATNGNTLDKLSEIKF